MEIAKKAFSRGCHCSHARWAHETVVGQQGCPRGAEGSELTVGSGLCLPRARPCSAAGRAILTIWLF